MRTSRVLRRKRSGVILIVVLALLTLFEIVGITFAFVGDTATGPMRQFRTEAIALARQSLRLAKILEPDLLRSLRRTTDFSDSVAELDALESRTVAFKNHVRTASASEPEPEIVRMLVNLCESIEDLQAKIEWLRRLIEQL